MSYAWMGGSPATRYGGSFLSTRCDPAAAENSGLAAAATPPASKAHHAWHWDSPLFWVGAIIVAAVGLGGAATTVRVGPAKAGLKVGEV